jgi:hypothetical protein
MAKKKVKFIGILRVWSILFTMKELNMRQYKWLELIKDYDCLINYHSGKTNVVTDAFSRKLSRFFVVMLTFERQTMLDL